MRLSLHPLSFSIGWLGPSARCVTFPEDGHIRSQPPPPPPWGHRGIQSPKSNYLPASKTSSLKAPSAGTQALAKLPQHPFYMDTQLKNRRTCVARDEARVCQEAAHGQRDGG